MVWFLRRSWSLGLWRWRWSGHNLSFLVNFLGLPHHFVPVRTASCACHHTYPVRTPVHSNIEHTYTVSHKTNQLSSGVVTSRAIAMNLLLNRLDLLRFSVAQINGEFEGFKFTVANVLLVNFMHGGGTLKIFYLTICGCNVN